MKKRLILFLLASSCFLAGCGSDKNDNSWERTKDVSATESVMSTEEFFAEAEEPVNLIEYEGETYTWNEITITIPVDWEERYIIKEEANGFSFYQKASNDIEESLGYLCGIYKSNSYSNAGAGDTLVAYTDEGVCYYLMQPTDVTCYTEDETIVEDYRMMMERVPWIASGVQIALKNVFYDASQYVIPVSSIMKLESYHMANLTDNELWIARNEIYARHGKLFKNEYLQAYFNACSWYQPKEGKTDVSERELNEMELANLDLIVAAESAYKTAHPYPKEYETGKSVSVPLQGDGSIQKVRYEVSENGDDYHCILVIDEKEYNLNDYVSIIRPEADIFYITDISESFGVPEFEDGLEIAVMDYGPSDDLETYFFKYDGSLRYIGNVEGFPFEEQEYLNGFNGQNGIMGQTRIDLIETAYVDMYYWYDRENQTIEAMDLGLYNYKWFNAHELYLDIPVYYAMDEASPTRILTAQSEVFFIKTDLKEWIFVRGKDGTEGYIKVKDGNILNIGLPAEEVFSELNFFG